MSDTVVITASDHSDTGAEAPVRRVVFWGTYDLGKPRTRILRDGLREIGVEVVEIHANVWAGHEDKSQAKRGALLSVAIRVLLAYPALIWRYLRAPAHDAVIIPYLGQLDVLVFRPFAWLRRRPVAWDMFISLYDTVVCDRRLARPGGVIARALRALEWCACRAADKVLLDTPAHARRIVGLFGLSEDRICAVPVGAEPDAFARLPARERDGGPVRVLFYGQLIPLHGVGTILEAALSERGRKHQWHLIGSGQERARVEAALADVQATHITWEKWCPYEALTDAIAQSDVCLGIFGASDKAASVVPNKVYQALLAGRSVVTRRSAAMEEAISPPHPGLVLVEHSDPEALLDGIDALAAEGCPALSEDRLRTATPAEIAHRLLTELKPLTEGNPAHAE